MQKITIIGTSCSGKTTLARRLSQKVNIPHIELDQLHWRENWNVNPNFVTEVEFATSKDRWVIDGNYTKVRQQIWDKADTIIWLASAPEAGKVSGKFWLDREPHLSAILPGTAGTAEHRSKLIESLAQIAGDVN